MEIAPYTSARGTVVRASASPAPMAPPTPWPRPAPPTRPPGRSRTDEHHPEHLPHEPLEIGAIQRGARPESPSAIVTWSGAAVSSWFDGATFMSIRTPGGGMRADVDAWSIRGVQGELSPENPASST